MLHCVFTIDYEIFGNGDGDLAQLVTAPTRKLIDLFRRHDARFVCFAEVAEFQRIEEAGTDPGSPAVREQLRELREGGFEIGLHLHPQWFNATRNGGRWVLDYSEYNLCRLPEARVREILRQALDYLRDVLREPDFTPISFRAGNWLLQPTERVAGPLRDAGFKIDSSVSKGLLQTFHGLDYRGAIRNPAFWRFDRDVTAPAPDGALLEIPIYTIQVPFWKLLTKKRVAIHAAASRSRPSRRERLCRLRDRARFLQPLKFDFCRMTLQEMFAIIDHAQAASRNDEITPVVAIGHSKDLVDFDAIDQFLSGLRQRGIPISTLADIHQDCLRQESSASPAPLQTAIR